MTDAADGVDVFGRLRAAIEQLERDLDPQRAADLAPSDAILLARAERIAKRPEATEVPPDTVACLVFERADRRYAAPLECLRDVTPLDEVTPVPGLPDMYLGVTARKGQIVSVIDLPRIFSPGVRPPAEPRWLVSAAAEESVCGVACDMVHDVIDVTPSTAAEAMPTFPALTHQHTLGVLPDRTVVIDLRGLMTDKALRVEELG